MTTETTIYGYTMREIAEMIRWYKEKNYDGMIKELAYSEREKIDKSDIKAIIDRLRIGIKYARDNPINESTEMAAQTQLDLIGIFEEKLGL